MNGKEVQGVLWGFGGLRCILTLRTDMRFDLGLYVKGCMQCEIYHWFASIAT